MLHFQFVALRAVLLRSSWEFGKGRPPLLSMDASDDAVSNLYHASFEQASDRRALSRALSFMSSSLVASWEQESPMPLEKVRRRQLSYPFSLTSSAIEILNAHSMQTHK